MTVAIPAQSLGDALSAFGWQAHVRQDLLDLDRSSPADAPFGHGSPDAAGAIGWLRVAEGLSLGAAGLSKRAAAPGLDEGFGARHLAGHPEGRSAHRRTFTIMVKALGLGGEEERRMIDGACEAFAHVHGPADASLA